MKSITSTIKGFFDNKCYNFGLALSGGGAKGFAHLGTLLALQKFGLRPDILSGVSAGSIVATMYAAGLTPMEIVDCFSAYDGFKDFTAITVPRSGFFKLDKFAKILSSWLPVSKLEDLEIPTIVCATDIEKGRSVGWCRGEIAPRVIASCSMPIIFTPVGIEGVKYVDGGVLRNLPAWAIRDKCRVLLGSNCSPLGADYKFRNSIYALAWRSYNLMSKSNTLQDSLLCDFVIRHKAIAHVNTFDMKNLHNIVLRGYEASCPLIEEMLKSKSL